MTKESTMEWLIEYAAPRRAKLMEGAFMQALPGMDRARIARWLPSLEYFSHRFVQSLFRRVGHCRMESPMLHTFLLHASLEGDHPEKIWKWMQRHEFPHYTQAPGPTQATLKLGYNFMVWAKNLDPDILVASHNVAAEGAALDFFAAVIPVVQRLGLNDTPYWRGHQDDDLHMRMGLDLMAASIPADPVQERPEVYRDAIDQAFNGFEAMYQSWYEA
jgi:hypothetical protein